MDPVSVALPVYRAPEGFERAVESIQRQTLGALDLMLVLNGADAPTRWRAHEISRADPRVRIIELPRAGLAAALNESLRQAKHELVARMDADDTCEPDRLRLQVQFLGERPGIVAAGTAFRQVLASGELLRTVHPPTDPREIRWRLMLDNVFAHGSMMMRRGPVLAAGGYDESCDKAQDFDLWLRLSRTYDLSNLGEVLYTYTVADRATHGRPTPAQAATVAARLARAWEELPASREQYRAALIDGIAGAHSGGPGAARALAALEKIMTVHGPDRTALTAYLYATSRSDTTSAAALAACRASRLREIGSQLKQDGVTRVWLWGAGDHTRWICERRDDLGLEIAGVVDDARAGASVAGFTARAPETLRSGETVLLSSDRHEDTMWESSRPHRARGVRVVRFYGPDRDTRGMSVPRAPQARALRPAHAA